MASEFNILLVSAFSIGFLHTLIGPDHYLPFIAMSKARNWSLVKTCVVTLLCGLGHVLSSVVLGFAGIALGVAAFKLEAVEAFRGEIAVWFLLIFGFTYFICGLRRAIKNKPHTHIHAHGNGNLHGHLHMHKHEHSHVHEMHEVNNHVSLTPWILFTIFVFGPCEPLIPLLMYPAAKGHIGEVVLVSAVFGLTTIFTMIALVLAFLYGLSWLPINRWQRFNHALAGLVIFLCGGAIKFLGL
ncbi:MAG: sulfite exporter TauE/SafE family protein [Candidatus Omnitrophica bacterium]|nr:sulfite exporter TauE/SafE family protein [Candidatus Omnitrophota bacterium]